MSTKRDAGPGRPPGAPAQRQSGRVRFDSRGQAVWEWSVQTGMFDRNASTQRIRSLTETPLSLAPEAPKPAPRAAAPVRGRDLYERATPKPGESRGGDPYASGPAKRPEAVTFNPYERIPPKKP